MFDKKCLFLIASTVIGSVAAQAKVSSAEVAITFDRIHTYQEVAAYLEDALERYRELTELHRIGKSYLGKDLLVLEITNEATGSGSLKPGYFIDGNLHSGEVIGCAFATRTVL